MPTEAVVGTKTTIYNRVTPAVDQIELRNKYERLLQGGSLAKSEVENILETIRKLILEQGLPVEEQAEANLLRDNIGGCSLRGRIWKALLRIKNIDARFYISCIEQGASEKQEKIIQDVYRTLPKDIKFQERVPHSRLVRVLNTFFWNHGGDRSMFVYQQSLSYILAPYLYTMSEVEAFYCFKRLTTKICPTYLMEGSIGVYAGCKLVEAIIEAVDKELYDMLKSPPSGVVLIPFSGNVLFLKDVTAFSAQIDAYTESNFDVVMPLWDFYHAYGFHMNLLCIAAKFIQHRSLVVEKHQGTNVMLTAYNKTPLNAKFLILEAIKLLPKIPNDLYDKIVQHMYQKDLCIKLTKS